MNRIEKVIGFVWLIVLPIIICGMFTIALAKEVFNGWVGTYEIILYSLCMIYLLMYVVDLIYELITKRKKK